VGGEEKIAVGVEGGAGTEEVFVSNTETERVLTSQASVYWQ
jgi:hypothetical protein